MAQVNWNRQLALALGLFALGTAAYWLEYKHKPEKEASEEQSKKLFQVKDRPIKAITLVDGSNVVTMSCLDLASKLCKANDNSKWEITQPSKLKADDASVNALVSTLSNLTSNDTIDLKDETPEKRSALIKEYGLDASARKSSGRVEVETENGKTVLYIGQAHPIGETIYAVSETVAAGQNASGKADENQVYLVPNHFKSSLDHDLAYWRNKKLFTVSSHEVESFRYEGPQAKVSAEKKDGQWILKAGGEEMSGDSDGIEGLLSAATQMTAKGFASDSKADAKAKAALKGFNPVLTLTLQKEKGSAKDAPEPVTFTLYQKKPLSPTGTLYGTVSNLDPLFDLEPGSLNRLNKSVKDLRQTKLITSMDRFGAKRLEFSGAALGGSNLVLENKDGKWTHAATHEEVQQDKVHTLLEKLSGNRINEFLSASTAPAGEKEGLTLKLGDEKNASKRELVIWKNKDKLYARDLQSKRKEAFVVDPALKDALPWNPDFFKKTDSKEGAKSGTDKK
jgi:hypothetical protein